MKNNFVLLIKLDGSITRLNRSFSMWTKSKRKNNFVFHKKKRITNILFIYLFFYFVSITAKVIAWIRSIFQIKLLMKWANTTWDGMVFTNALRALMCTLTPGEYVRSPGRRTVRWMVSLISIFFFFFYFYSVFSLPLLLHRVEGH